MPRVKPSYSIGTSVRDMNGVKWKITGIVSGSPNAYRLERKNEVRVTPVLEVEVQYEVVR